MSSTELFLHFLKKMQETAKKIEPAPKELVEKVVLSAPSKSGSASIKKDDKCLF